MTFVLERPWRASLSAVGHLLSTIEHPFRQSGPPLAAARVCVCVCECECVCVCVCVCVHELLQSIRMCHEALKCNACGLWARGVISRRLLWILPEIAAYPFYPPRHGEQETSKRQEGVRSRGQQEVLRGGGMKAE